MKINDNGDVRDMTEAEIERHREFLESSEYKSAKICYLRNLLAETDYKTIKFSEGWLTEEEYAPIREYRQNLRDQINELEG